MIAAMAPGLIPCIFIAALHIDTMLSAIASDNVAKQIGASWTYGITGNTPNLLQQLAAEGITFFTAGRLRCLSGARPSDRAGLRGQSLCHLRRRDDVDHEWHRRLLCLRKSLELERQWRHQRRHQHDLLDSFLAAGH
jgi:hypothetical protein